MVTEAKEAQEMAWILKCLSMIFLNLYLEITTTKRKLLQERH
jgi:hypothetical protein